MIPTLNVLTGDCRAQLRTLPDKSVHCVVTSPPYWGLRDYGTATWTGGVLLCDHRQPLGGDGEASAMQNTSAGTQTHQYRDVCGKCGAVRTDTQIGLEATPALYVETMVGVFAEIWRVLRDDGTLWLDIGDTYCNSDKWGGGGANTGKHTKSPDGSVPSWAAVRRKWADIPDIKPKDLVGIPWRLALALQAAGWYLRSDIIWHKSNPMPESVTDRPTKSHEYIFLLTKSPTYFYDAEAIKEPTTGTAHPRGDGVNPKAKTPGANSRLFQDRDPSHSDARKSRQNASYSAAVVGLVDSRNKRTVWTVPSAPYRDAHFATFPPNLIKPCILAGTSERGVCPKCGAPWERITNRAFAADSALRGQAPKGMDASNKWSDYPRGTTATATTGWQPTCACKRPDTIPATVLDPFGGSGTTGLVSLELGRSAVLIELNPEYVKQITTRTNVTPSML